MDEFASRGYPVNEDMGFQRRSWTVERAGWIVLAVIAIAGLAGLFGNGPASWRTARLGELTVSYEQFQRATRASAFVFTARAGADGELKLHLGAPFQRNFEFVSIQPQPVRSRTAPDGLTLTFSAEAGAPARVVIWARSRHYGLNTIAAALDGAAPAPIWVMVYP
jgi:hypothetical protein